MICNVIANGKIPVIGGYRTAYGVDLTDSDIDRLMQFINSGTRVYVADTGQLITPENIDEILGRSSGGGTVDSGALLRSINANTEAGGIKSGTIFQAGTTNEALWNSLLVSYKPPVFTVYSTPAPSGDIDAPFGSEIGPVEYFVNFTSLGDVVADSINVTVKQGMTTIGTTDVTGLGTFSVKDPNAVNITNTYMVHVSWLNKPGDTERIINTTNFAFKFSHYSYYGIVDVAPDALDETKIKELPTVLKLDADYTCKSIVMTNQRVCYATPTQYGDVKVIKDSNGFDITSAFTFSTMTINDQPYTVITLTNTGTYPASAPGTIIFSK